MPPAGFESTISAGERLQTYALDRATTGTSKQHIIPSDNYELPGFITAAPVEHSLCLQNT
jgi:hypothetical protein